jgi:hypothetical protein
VALEGVEDSAVEVLDGLELFWEELVLAWFECFFFALEELPLVVSVCAIPTAPTSRIVPKANKVFFAAEFINKKSPSLENSEWREVGCIQNGSGGQAKVATKAGA